jgi:hypothetical protein
MARNFYRAEHAPYYIYALDYIQQSAGIRALHYLCHALNESGMEAYVTCQQTLPSLRTPVLTGDIIGRHYASGRMPIMVYPEIVSGDPMALGGVVVRWLLNRPGHIGGDSIFPENNIIFSYDPVYLVDDLQGEILHIPTCDLSIFNNESNHFDGDRDMVCFYAHKYLLNGGQLTGHVVDAISLGKEQVITHHEMAEILRRSKLLYVYEPTALIAEALLCGCPVSIIKTNYWQENMSNHTYASDFGIVMDDSYESLMLARKNVHKYTAIHVNSQLHDAWIQLDHFVTLTQNAVHAKIDCGHELLSIKS